jgi:AcrR family transcriptional regulator
MPRRSTVTTRRTGRVQPNLTRDRITAAAVEIADRDGIESVSMRRLAQGLGVDPMSLYNHVRDKDDLLDAMADAIVGEIETSSADGDWKGSLRDVLLSARTAMLRHPWAAGVLETRVTPGPATMRHMEVVLGIVRRGGFSMDLAHHGLHVLGSRVFGFSQDLFDDKSEPVPDQDALQAISTQMAVAYPNIAELALAVRHEGGLGGCDDDVEFRFGIDLIIDGLERLREREPARAEA